MPSVSVRALCYSGVTLPHDFLAGGPRHSNEGLVEGAMTLTLISRRDDDGTVHHELLDAGFDDPVWLGRFRFHGFTAPAALLAAIGVGADRIERIHVSHMHFDHVHGVRDFPAAEVWIQRAELDGWRRVAELGPEYTPLGHDSWISHSFDPDDLQTLDALDAAGRLRVLDGDEPVAQGIMARTVGPSHTFGTQWLEVDGADGPIVVASDAVMTLSNLEEMYPSGATVGSPFNCLLLYGDVVRRVGGDLSRVVAGHDLAVYERNPSVRVGDARVAELQIADWDRSLAVAALDGGPSPVG